MVLCQIRKQKVFLQTLRDVSTDGRPFKLSAQCAVAHDSCEGKKIRPGSKTTIWKTAEFLFRKIFIHLQHFLQDRWTLVINLTIN